MCVCVWVGVREKERAREGGSTWMPTRRTAGEAHVTAAASNALPMMITCFRVEHSTAGSRVIKKEKKVERSVKGHSPDCVPGQREREGWREEGKGGAR